MMRPLLLAPLAALAFLLAAGRSDAQSIQAVRLDGQTIRLDGRLTEDVWRAAPAVSGLLQREPDEGQPAIEPSEVRFAYDEDALYVGARMYAKNPREIRAIVSRRDRQGSAEALFISLDTYRDRRTAYSYGVTAGGVRVDCYHGSDNLWDCDDGYDPVWEAEARVDSLGWTAEMRIPFAQLRFSPSEIHEWGVNVLRMVPARNEESMWQLVRRSEPGWASRMGVLEGIRGIRPSRRIEATPYVAANSRFARVTDPADPFQRARESEARVGGDLKMGLGPNLTLDVTLNPDFGQVEADPAIVNLTAYEVFFDERRPFFSEGADLFNRRGMFYSRRIGAPPPVGASADFAQTPDNTTILGAAKLSGRLPSGLSVAALSAVTDREVVRTYDLATSRFGRATVAPRTYYGVAAAQQEFGADRSTIHGMLTLVNRDVEPGSAVASAVPRLATSGLVEGRLRWAGGTYDVNSWIGFTDVRGDTAAILGLQRSSRRYWQRPDADHVDVDSTRRALRGATFAVGHSKSAGKHWLWDIDYLHETPGFEPNDIGAFGAVDNRFAQARVRWRETEAGRWYRRYTTGVAIENQWNYDWITRFRETSAFFDVVLANFWDVTVGAWHLARARSDRLTRGGPLMGTPQLVGGDFEFATREGGRNRWGVEVGYERDENGGWENGLELFFSFRPGDRLELSFDPEWQRGVDTRQYVMTQAGGRPATFDTRYVFAHVERNEVSGRMRVNYTFTPNLTLETYAEPFASSGRYFAFGELRRVGGRDLLTYGTNGTTIARGADGSHTVTDGASSFTIAPQDFNVRSFRSNVVLRWEWRLGSTLYLVWQQDRAEDRVLGRARPGTMWSALDAPGNNFLAIKASYWLALR